jgi:hypothetical protein
MPIHYFKITGCLRFNCQLGQKFVLSLHPDQLWDPLSLLLKEYWGALSIGAKRLAREADHLPPSSAEVKHA